MQNLPTRFHIGQPRSGSSFLFNLLSQHPQVVLSPRQDVNFYHRQDRRTWEWYRGQFVGDGVPIDTSPKYFVKGATVAPRILDTLGRAEPRFLLVLRNPVDYVRSHFQMHRRLGWFERNPDRYPDPDLPLLEFVTAHPDYLDRARYHRLLTDHWLPHFDRNSFHLVTFEELVGETPRVTREITEFFGLEPMELSAPPSGRNATLRWPVLRRLQKRVVRHPRLKETLKGSRVFNRLYSRHLVARDDGLDGRTRALLRDALIDDVRALADDTGIDVSRWRDFAA